MNDKRINTKINLINYKFQNKTFPIYIRNSKGKKLVLKLDYKKQIILLKPFFVPWGECELFLDKYFVKIYEKIVLLIQNKKYDWDKKWCFIWGQKYLIILSDKVKKYAISEQGIFLNKEKPLLNFEKFKKFLSHQIILWAQEILEKENLEATITIKKLSRTWGICHSNRKKISLSLRLIHFSEAIVKYVIYHEVMHLIHPNHSLDFKNDLAKRIPNYKNLKKQLVNW